MEESLYIHRAFSNLTRQKLSSNGHFHIVAQNILLCESIFRTSFAPQRKKSSSKKDFLAYSFGQTVSGSEILTIIRISQSHAQLTCLIICASKKSRESFYYQKGISILPSTLCLAQRSMHMYISDLTVFSPKEFTHEILRYSPHQEPAVLHLPSKEYNQ